MPTKATLPRGSAQRNSSKRKVPPIALGSGKARAEEVNVDTARDSIYNDIYDDDSASDEVRLLLNRFNQELKRRLNFCLYR